MCLKKNYVLRNIDAKFVVFYPQVQAFGYGGTNAHVILDDAYHFLEQKNLSGIHFTVAAPMTAGGYSQSAYTNMESIRQDTLDFVKRDRIFLISSQDQDGLKRQKESLAGFLEGRVPSPNEDALLCDLSFTLSEKRSHLEWRTYKIASSIDGLASGLRDEAPELPAVRRSLSPRIGFVFTGQGSQWARMGADLLQYAVFHESMEQADLHLRQHLNSGWFIVEELFRDVAESKIDMPSYCQPICTALQIALIDLLESWNIKPSAIVGHSSGEIAGAYCLGALSKEDALVAAFYRGLFSESIKAQAPGLEGAMLAVGASESEVRTWLDKFTGENLGIACVNSPSSVTLSGDVQAVNELENMLKQNEIFVRRLNVANAYHSPHMDVIVEPYLQSMRNLRVLPGKGDRKMHSSTTGESIDWSELGALNWVRNLVSPVLFYDALLDLIRPQRSDGECIKQNAVDVLLEVGPHATLKSAVKETMNVHDIKGVKYFSVLSKRRSGIRTILEAAGSLFAEGVPVRMIKANTYTDKTYGGCLGRLVDLPAYSWNHTRTYWAESRFCKQHRHRQHPQSSLLGAPFPQLSEKGKIWRGISRLSEASWLKDHCVQGSILYPAAGFITMVIEAAGQVAEHGLTQRGFKLRDIQITAPVSMSEDFETEFVLQFSPQPNGTRDNLSTFTRFVISTSNKGQDLRQNCSGLLLIEYQYVERSNMALEHVLENLEYRDRYRDTLQSCYISEEPEKFYQGLAEVGLKFGPAFRRLSDICSGEGLSCYSVTVPDIDLPSGLGDTHRPHFIHPTTLDAMLHSAFAAFKPPKGRLSSAMVPRSIDEVFVSADIAFSAGSKFQGFSQASRQVSRGLISEIVILDSYLLEPVVLVKGFCCATLPANIKSTRDEIVSGGINILSKALWKPVLFRNQPGGTSSLFKDTQVMDNRGEFASPDESGVDLKHIIEDFDESARVPVDIIIIEAHYPSESSRLLCTRLTDELESNKISVKRRSWGPNIPDLAGKDSIAVVDLHECLLFDATEEDFNTLKRLILQSSSLMWISTASDPAGDLAAGMMRSIRNEIPGKNLRTLKVSHDALVRPDHTAMLIRNLLVRSTMDSEFVEEDRVLKVCRIVEDESMNKDMSKWIAQQEESIEESPLKEAQGPQKLALGMQGMLDTLYLEFDDKAERPIEGDEVEIQVRMTAMK